MTSSGFSKKEYGAWERKVVSANNNTDMCKHIQIQHKRCFKSDSSIKCDIFHMQFLFQYCSHVKSIDGMRHSEKL